MIKYDQYQSTVLLGSRVNTIEALTKVNLSVERDDFSGHTEGAVIGIQTGFNYVAIEAKDARLTNALTTIENEHNVMPSHIISVIGGQCHFYPVSHF